MSADTNGDGSIDVAHLGRARSLIYVGLVLGGSGAVSILDFAISTSTQDAICAEPADGECDSIHLYWNHDRNRLSGWRM